MTLHKIQELLNADLITDSTHSNFDITFAKASDLMSDVLAFSQPFSKPDTILLTGLTNKHVVRTCDIAGVCAIVFVRGKNPPSETIDLAQTCEIPLFVTKLKLFEACGILYAHGIRPPSANQK
ncbi:MAG: hypothetical protein JSV97_12155 [candidate division WOR-3 bacterium]|nr:MAG: hypothetical protein JSV97_12155 [candidate division WOR-3 bacterium]